MRTSMLRGVLGCRLMRPARSSVSANLIPCFRIRMNVLKKPPALDGGVGRDWTAKRTSIGRLIGRAGEPAGSA